jgi:hypothetical protein
MLRQPFTPVAARVAPPPRTSTLTLPMRFFADLHVHSKHARAAADVVYVTGSTLVL